MKKLSDRGQQCYCNHSTYIHTHTHTHTHTFSLSHTHAHSHTHTHTLCTIIGQQNHSSATSTDFRILCCSSFHQSRLGSHCPCHRRSWLRCSAGCHTWTGEVSRWGRLKTRQQSVKSCTGSWLFLPLLFTCNPSFLKTDQKKLQKK